jgi:hypothetical protein
MPIFETILRGTNNKIAPALTSTRNALEARFGRALTATEIEVLENDILRTSRVLAPELENLSPMEAYITKNNEFLADVRGWPVGKNVEFSVAEPNLPAKTPTAADVRFGPWNAARQWLGYQPKLTPGQLKRPFISQADVAEHQFGPEHSRAIDETDTMTAANATNIAALRILHPYMAPFKRITRNREFTNDFVGAFDQYGSTLPEYLNTHSAVEDILRAQSAGKATIAQISRLPILQTHLADLDTQIRDVLDPLYFKWAPRSPDVRIALLTDANRYRNILTDSTVQPFIEPTEVEAAARLNVMQDKLREAAIKQDISPKYAEFNQYGMPMLKKYYMRQNPQTAAMIDEFIPQTFRESKAYGGHFLYMPSAKELTYRMLPSAVQKVTYTPYVRKWQDVAKGLETRYPDLAKDIRENLEGRSFADDEGIVDKMVAWQYADKLGLNLGPAVKHAFKTADTFMRMPLSTLEATPETMKSVITALSNSKVAQKLGMPNLQPSELHKLAQTVLLSREIWRGSQGLSSQYSPFVKDTLQHIMAGPVAATEGIERMLTLYSTVMKGYRNDLDINQWLRFFYQSQLDLNFIGAIDKLPILNNAWKRFAFMFTYTPLRILTRNLKDVLYGLIPYKQYHVMEDGLARASWHMRTDAFGTPYYRHMLMRLGTLYVMDQIARANDVDIRDIAAFHIPMMRHTAKGLQFNPPLPVKAVKDAYGVLPPEPKTEDFRAAFVAVLEDFIRLYGIEKVQRVWQNEIPTIYQSPYGNWSGRYLAALPSWEQQRKAAVKFEPAWTHQALSEQKRRREFRKKEVWPFNKVFESIAGD